jgi:prepilin-type N-terminal cleavage/methylation domain-containing protein
LKSRNLRKQSRKGFTIIEVMVVVVIMGIITTVVATMFAQGASALQHGDAHNSLQRAYRLITARMTPYLASAFDGTNLMQGAPLLDPTGTTDNQYDPAPTDASGVTWLPNTIRFLSTEDFLALNYPAQGNSAEAALSLTDINAFVYQINLVDTNGDGNEDVVLQKLNPSSSFAVVTDFEKPLFFGRDSSRIANDDPTRAPLRFYHPSAHVVVMEVDLTSDADFTDNTRKINPSQTFRSTFNLPSKGQQ